MNRNTIRVETTNKDTMASYVTILTIKSNLLIVQQHLPVASSFLSACHRQLLKCNMININ